MVLYGEAEAVPIIPARLNFQLSPKTVLLSRYLEHTKLQRTASLAFFCQSVRSKNGQRCITASI